MDNWMTQLFELLTADEHRALSRVLCLGTGATLGMLWSMIVGG